MNSNYLKRPQVVSAGNHQNHTDANKNKSEVIDQTSCCGHNEISKGGEFSMFCKDNARKCFQEKTLPSLSLSIDKGN